MTWRDVARRDLLSEWRSRLVPAVFLALLAFSAGTLAVLLALDSEFTPPPAQSQAVLVVGSVLSLFVPLLALVATYAALVGERTSGSVRFLLGLPNSRLDAFAGKYASRGGLVLASLVVGFGLGAVPLLAGFREVAPGEFALVGLATLVYALVFVGLGLAVSALFSTDTRAVAGAIGVFLLFRVGWPGMQALALRQFTPRDEYVRPAWYFLLGRVNPINAYVATTVPFVHEDPLFHPLLTTTDGVETVYRSPAFAAAVLLAWAVVAPVLGYLRFRGIDLL